MNYIDRLGIDINGNDNTEFYTSCKFNLFAKGYERIVIGARGPYIEFNSKQLNFDFLWIPPDCEWRRHAPGIYYLEYRTKDQSYVKVYFQKRVVSYADYKVGKYYASPFDLYVDGEPIITKEKAGYEAISDFAFR